MTTILVIDDDDLLRGMLREMLEIAGYEVREAVNGRQGLGLFQLDPADLVVTDIVMPEQEGLETIVELRKAWPDVQIIAISGGGAYHTTDYLQSAKLLGAVQTFPKPCDSKELLAAIANILGQSSAGPA